MTPLVYLKFGGALLTEKDAQEACRFDVLQRLVGELASWPGLARGRLILCHGSGSFAHVAVRDTGFREHPDNPVSLAQVAAAARRLDSHVVDALLRAGLPALPLPGSVIGICDNGKVVDARADLVGDALAVGLLPVVYGDAAPDRVLGGAIASTEPLIAALAGRLGASSILLATDVDGVYSADPNAANGEEAVRLPVITPAGAGTALAGLRGTRREVTDVTGGMLTKVETMLDLVERHPGLQVRIFSGLRPGALLRALEGGPDGPGTLLRGE